MVKERVWRRVKGETKGEMQCEGCEGCVKVSGLSVKDSIANCTGSVYSSTMVVLAMAHIHSHVGVERLRSITSDYDRLRELSPLAVRVVKGKGTPAYTELTPPLMSLS